MRSAPPAFAVPGFRRLLPWSAGSLVLALLACGGGGGGGTGTSEPPQVAPVIVTQPASTRVALGHDATFTAQATGTPTPAYHWFVAGQEVAGTTGGTLVLPAVTTLQDQHEVWAVATNPLGSATSSHAVLTVVTPPSFGQVPASIEVDEGAFKGLPLDVRGTRPLTCRWRRDGVDLPAAQQGTETLLLYGQKALDGSRYTLTISNEAGSADSGPIQVKVTTPRQARIDPGNWEARAGDVVSFKCSVDGRPTPTWTYWYLNGVLQPWGNNGDTLTLGPLTLADNGKLITAQAMYEDRIFQARTFVLTVTADRTVPRVRRAPVDVHVVAGQDALFRASASGTSPALSWTWKGAPVAGATTGTLTLPAVSLSDDGSTVLFRAANSEGEATASAVLHVRAPGTDPAPADILFPAEVRPGQRGLPALAPDRADVTCTWSLIPGTASATLTAQGAQALVDVGTGEGTFTLSLTRRTAAGLVDTATRTVDVRRGTWQRPHPDTPIPTLAGRVVPLASGFILVAGITGPGVPCPMQLLDPASGTCTMVRPGLLAHDEGAVFTRLADGRVLAVGGNDGNRSEVFDPTTGTWRILASTFPETGRRTSMGVVTLRDGRVMIVGGVVQHDLGFTEACACFDPIAETWTVAAPLALARKTPGVALLPDGRVLAFGGAALASNTEIYDPAADAWTPQASTYDYMPIQGATLATLPDGAVLAVGGYAMMDQTQVLLDSSPYWDADLGRWLPSRPMAGSHLNGAALALPDGSILVAGGDQGGYGTPVSRALDNVERFDPRACAWYSLGALPLAMTEGALAAGPDGRVLMLGGRNALSVLQDADHPAPLPWTATLDPATGTWTPAGPVSRIHAWPTVASLADGRILVAGGLGSDGLPTAATGLLNPATGAWTNLPDLPYRVQGARATRLKDGRIFLSGGTYLASDGTGSPRASSFAAALDPVTLNWNYLATMDIGRVNHTATLLKGGEVLLAGGSGTMPAGTTLVFYDPIRDTYPTKITTGWGWRGHTSLLLADGRVLLSGGETQYGLGVVDLASTWFNPLPEMLAVRAGHTLTQFPDGRVLVVGGAPPWIPGPDTEWVDLAGARTVGPSLHVPRRYHEATLLPDGRLLIVGGIDVNNQPVCLGEIFDPATGKWSDAPCICQPMATSGGSPLVALPDGDLAIVDAVGPLIGLERYRP